MKLTEIEKMLLVIVLTDSLKASEQHFIIPMERRKSLRSEILTKNYFVEEGEEIKRINGIDDNYKNTQSK